MSYSDRSVAEEYFLSILVWTYVHFYIGLVIIGLNVIVAPTIQGGNCRGLGSTP